MSTIALQPLRFARTVSGNSPMVLVLPEAASQTFKKGEPVYLVAGYVTECGNNPAAILGFANEDASNDTVAGTSDVGVVIANDDNIFEMNKSDTAGAVAATAVTDVGKAFALYRDTTNSKAYAHVAEGAQAANGRFMCLAISGKDVVGDSGGRLLLHVIGKYRQLFVTS